MLSRWAPLTPPAANKKGVGIEVTSLFSIPAEEPATPATLQATGVRLPEVMVAAVGKPLTLHATPSAGERGPGGGEPYLDLQR